MYDLTIFNSAGGCSCKLPAAQLSEMLRLSGRDVISVGGETADDASFTTLVSGEVLVTSVDFQNPIVGDAELSGQIAALNAMSDILACGVQPAWADVILALPQIDTDSQVNIGRKMMAGIRQACASAGCAVVGGHTIVQPTPLVGLAVRGIAPADCIKRKSGAQPGDAILLTKPIGNGIAVAARQNGFLTDTDWNVALKAMLAPNLIGRELGKDAAVTSLTDVTGFGLVGHLLEVALASGIGLELEIESVPALPGTKRAAQAGHVPQLAMANWAFASDHTSGTEQLTNAERMFLADPQTNGGLLVTARSDETDRVIRSCLRHGVDAVRVGTACKRGTRACIVRKESK